MKNFLKQNKLAYLILFALLSVFTWLFLQAWPHKELQRIYVLVFGVSYFVWGLFTHTSSKTLNSNVVFEYLAVSLLASLMLVLITL